MIYRMMRDVEADLCARLYPLTFSYGPSPSRLVVPHRGLVEVERDTERGETIGPPVAARSNPRLSGVRVLGVKWTIFAQSGVDGAMRNDHEHECDLYVDAIQLAIYEWAKASGAGVIQFAEARYLSAAERTAVESPSDVAYLLRFGVPRGVMRRDYEGRARSVTQASAATNITEVYVSGQGREVI